MSLGERPQNSGPQQAIDDAEKWRECFESASQALDATASDCQQAIDERDGLQHAYTIACEVASEHNARCEQAIDALREAIDVAQWMSGSESFSPGGDAHEGWLKQRERLFASMATLDALVKS